MIITSVSSGKMNKLNLYFLFIAVSMLLFISHMTAAHSNSET